MEPYIPETLPLKGLNYEELITPVGEANSTLSEYNGLLQGMINPAILLSKVAVKPLPSGRGYKGTPFGENKKCKGLSIR